MYRQIIIPESNTFLLNLPADFIGRQVEVIAFPVEENQTLEEQSNGDKYSWDKALKFFKKNAVDFSKIEKWKREDLYE
ncbi:MAG: hypothetical protein HY958_14305 [Bacteroidia bacterium]|nr:hypothetical protein [Bacteroidia bacterium]